jgi:hypothetical protein
VLELIEMSDTMTPPAGVLPPLFHHVVGVNPALHGRLRLDRSAGFDVAVGLQSVPLGLAEFEAACQHFPILFAAGPRPAPVALLGLSEGSNLFVGEGGAWRPGCYVPAYLRAFPFVFLQDAATSTVYVGMEETASCLSTIVGSPLFEDGRPTPTLTEAIGFCSALRDNLASGTAFGQALEEEGLLEEEEATVRFTAGGGARTSLKPRMRADRLDRLSDATYLDWRRRGWIAAIHAHLHSAGRWARLIELAAPPGADAA